MLMGTRDEDDDDDDDVSGVGGGGGIGLARGPSSIANLACDELLRILCLSTCNRNTKLNQRIDRSIHQIPN